MIYGRRFRLSFPFSAPFRFSSFPFSTQVLTPLTPSWKLFGVVAMGWAQSFEVREILFLHNPTAQYFICLEEWSIDKDFNFWAIARIFLVLVVKDYFLESHGCERLRIGWQLVEGGFGYSFWCWWMRTKYALEWCYTIEALIVIDAARWGAVCKEAVGLFVVGNVINMNQWDVLRESYTHVIHRVDLPGMTGIRWFSWFTHSTYEEETVSRSVPRR